MGKSRRVEEREQPIEPVADQMNGLGMDVSPAELAAEKPKDNTRPYCPKHNCLMIANRSDKSATFYRCRVDGCDAMEVRMRPEHPAPTEPLMCPLCDRSGDQIACEVDRVRSSGKITLLMQCPSCKWEVEVPRPTAARIVKRFENRQFSDGPMASVARQAF